MRLFYRRIPKVVRAADDPRVGANSYSAAGCCARRRLIASSRSAVSSSSSRTSSARPRTADSVPRGILPPATLRSAKAIKRATWEKRPVRIVSACTARLRSDNSSRGVSRCCLRCQIEAQELFVGVKLFVRFFIHSAVCRGPGSEDFAPHFDRCGPELVVVQADEDRHQVEGGMNQNSPETVADGHRPVCPPSVKRRRNSRTLGLLRLSSRAGDYHRPSLEELHLRRLLWLLRGRTFRYQGGRFPFGTLGTFVLGLAAFVIFTLAFSNCVSLFGNKSRTFRFEPNRSPAST